MQQYENFEFGIRLDRPRKWNITFYERNGVIVLESKNGITSDNSARIEIFGYACIPVPTWSRSSYEVIKLHEDRIRILYSLDSVKIIQNPIKVENKENEVMQSIIAIPTISFPKNDVRNQMGAQNSSLYQIIEIFAISNNSQSVMVYIYNGKSDEVNAEAEEIVSSIQIVCSE